MRRILSAVGLLLCLLPAKAGWNGCPEGFCNKATAAASYTGPGDVVSGAKVFLGLRAYSAATRGNNVINICDPSNVTCADWKSDAVTGNLVATTNPLNGTDCTAVNTCKVKTIYDQSGALSCTGAACDVVQATNGSRPTFTWSCINSKPCLVYGSGIVNSSAAGFTSLSQPYTTVGVANRTSGTAASDVIIQTIGTANGQLSFRNAANTMLMFAGTVQTVASISDTFWHAFEATYNGASSVLFCAGSQGANCSNSGVANSVSPNTGASSGTLEIGDGADTDTFQFTEAGMWALDFTVSSRQNNMAANQIAYYGPF